MAIPVAAAPEPIQAPAAFPPSTPPTVPAGPAKEPPVPPTTPPTTYPAVSAPTIIPLLGLISPCLPVGFTALKTEKS